MKGGNWFNNPARTGFKPGVGGTEVLFINFSVREIFDLMKVPVYFF